MNIEIQRASISEKHVLRNLLELCEHDYSEYDGSDVDEHGLFGYKWLDHYWTEPERHPFLIQVDDRLAGFVLVRDLDSADQPATHSIAEFFVMRKYRRQGIGQHVARLIFDMFPGQWSVCQDEGNTPAQAFWQQVIAEYTQGNYQEETMDNWHGPCQRFHSRMVKP